MSKMRFRRMSSSGDVNSSLGIDEHRVPFIPTLWKITPDNQVTKLKQVWFSGGHSAVGGGDTYHGVSDITLAWMVQQIADNTKLEYDIDYLLASRSTFGPHQMSIAWATEDFPITYNGIWLLAGYVNRTPGKYRLANGERSNEFVHRSVLTRISAKGKAYVHPDISGLDVDKFGGIEQQLMW